MEMSSTYLFSFKHKTKVLICELTIEIENFLEKENYLKCELFLMIDSFLIYVFCMSCKIAFVLICRTGRTNNCRFTTCTKRVNQQRIGRQSLA